MEYSKCQNGTLEELNISSSERHLLLIMKNKPKITQLELAIETGKSVRTIKREMAELKEKGYIERINGKRHGEWQVLVDIM